MPEAPEIFVIPVAFGVSRRALRTRLPQNILSIAHDEIALPFIAFHQAMAATSNNAGSVSSATT
jgi:hypothetical protein